ncbi:hypothetical protein CXB51_024191 [Gossypium anomalum]|uniref:RNase H type-1 domain-containing protein n=1 Tax=Gossypium anomalum TaxID=47600 RepID=A0A8J5YUC0_9ROSI|nr:hypothetical protein CXB51_024191 [Gossypium anomalum]
MTTLIIGGLNNRLLDGNYIRCIDWLEDILRELDSKAAADFFTLFWNYAAVSSRNVGYGVIARDADGFVIAGSYVYENKAIDVVWAKLKALTLGMKLALRLK